MPPPPLRVPLLRFLRSNLFIAIVSLLVVTGYGFDLFGECCADERHEYVEHGKSAPNDQAPGGNDGCQCICHQVVPPISLEPVQMAVAVFVAADFVAHADEFPPDAVPLGIDYPPQLA